MPTAMSVAPTLKLKRLIRSFIVVAPFEPLRSGVLDGPGVAP